MSGCDKCYLTVTSSMNHRIATVLRSDYGIYADTKLISHDSAFSLASILLTSDFIRHQGPMSQRI